jgi:CDP-diacylglycerol--glycerol-3-phosphate 3-phosphatidyltransferase
VVNLPNALTLLRIFIVPLLVVVLLTPFSENWFGVPRHILGVVMFLAAALTDYLDGHFARSRGQVTRLGQLLDPIADKLLISAALISLVENQLAPAWAVALLIASSVAGRPPVANFGRPFPAIEFWSVPELRSAWEHLFGNGAITPTDWQVLVYTAGRALLWLVVISACVSMYGYFSSFYRAVMSGRAAQRENKTASVAVVRE